MTRDEIKIKFQEINTLQDALDSAMDPLRDMIQNHIQTRIDLKDPLMPFDKHMNDADPELDVTDFGTDSVLVTRSLWWGDHFEDHHIRIPIEHLAMSESEIQTMVRETIHAGEMAKKLDAEHLAFRNEATERVEFERLQAKYGDKS